MEIDGHMTYTGGTADEYRASVLSIGIGPFYLGGDSICTPITGRSVVIDDVTGKILHVGGDKFLY
jgi:hypothetical protein